MDVPAAVQAFDYDEYVSLPETERRERWPHTKVRIQDAGGSETPWARELAPSVKGVEYVMLDNYPLSGAYRYADIVRATGGTERHIGTVAELVRRIFDRMYVFRYSTPLLEWEGEIEQRTAIRERLRAAHSTSIDVSFMRAGVGCVLARGTVGDVAVVATLRDFPIVTLINRVDEGSKETVLFYKVA